MYSFPRQRKPLVLELDARVDGMITTEVEPGLYNVWHKECDAEQVALEDGEEEEEADESAEPEVFLADDAQRSETTVEVTEPAEAMIFEKFQLSTEVLVVNTLRNGAVVPHPDNPDQLVYQPPHARRPVYDRPLLSIATAVTQAGIKPEEAEAALPEGHHLDWNFTLKLEDGQRPEGLPAPVTCQLSCKDRSQAENGNRVDGRVIFPKVTFPHRGGTANFTCDAQVAPPRNLPADAAIDPLADFATLHPDLFDLNAQMDFEYPSGNRRNGWWAVSVCMEHWENTGTEEDPEKRFFRKRCAKKRHLSKSDDFRVRGDAEAPARRPRRPPPRPTKTVKAATANPLTTIIQGRQPSLG